MWFIDQCPGHCYRFCWYVTCSVSIQPRHCRLGHQTCKNIVSEFRGFYPYTCWAQLAPSEKQGGEFSSWVIWTCSEWHFFRTTGLSVTADKNPPFYCFYSPPQTFLFPPQLFPWSILLPPVIGVDAPPPIYSGREWWKRTKNYQTSRLTQVTGFV